MKGNGEEDRRAGASLSEAVEIALDRCGRERVFHNDGSPPSIAIRWLSADAPAHVERWITESGTDHSEAGTFAARKFAKRLRDEGERLLAWAQRITDALDPDRV